MEQAGLDGTTEHGIDSAQTNDGQAAPAQCTHR